MDIPAALQHIVDGQDLSQEQATQVFHTIMSGAATPAQIGALLAALRVKGETAEEIAGAAMTMRELSTKVEVDVPHLVDTCGTGGSGLKLFNISTAAAFVAAAAGAHVAKHGNRKNDQLQRQCGFVGSSRSEFGAKPRANSPVH